MPGEDTESVIQLVGNAAYLGHLRGIGHHGPEGTIEPVDHLRDDLVAPPPGVAVPPKVLIFTAQRGEHVAVASMVWCAVTMRRYLAHREEHRACR